MVRIKRNNISFEYEIIPVIYDNIFHMLLNKENVKTLEFAVSSIMNYTYPRVCKNVSVLNIRLTTSNTKQKQKYVDLILKIEDTILILELNNNYEGNYTRNYLFMVQELLNNYNLPIEKSKTKKNYNKIYEKIVRVILVNLNWYKSIIKREKIPFKEVIETPYPSEDVEGNVSKIININMDKVSKMNYNEITNDLYFYKLLTITNKKELDDFLLLYDKNNLLSNYKKIITKISNGTDYEEGKMSENIEFHARMQDSYLDGVCEGKRLGINQGIDQGITQGINLGREETQIFIAKNLLKNKMPLAKIIEITGISKSNLELVQKEI